MYQRVRDLREDKDLKQRQLAMVLSIAQTTYSDYELGKLNIPVSVLVKLAAFYCTSIDYILGLTDEKAPYPRKAKPPADIPDVLDAPEAAEQQEAL